MKKISTDSMVSVTGGALTGTIGGIEIQFGEASMGVSNPFGTNNFAANGGVVTARSRGIGRGRNPWNGTPGGAGGTWRGPCGGMAVLCP